MDRPFRTVHLRRVVVPAVLVIIVTPLCVRFKAEKTTYMEVVFILSKLNYCFRGALSVFYFSKFRKEVLWRINVYGVYADFAFVDPGFVILQDLTVWLEQCPFIMNPFSAM